MDIFITFFAWIGAMALGVVLYHWWLKLAPQAETVKGAHRCKVCLCELPAGTLKTHTGDWACRTHKSASTLKPSSVSTTQDHA